MTATNSESSNAPTTKSTRISRITRRGWNIVRSPAVGAAVGAFIGFIATQGAEYWRDTRTQTADLMLSELDDGRQAVNEFPVPKTSAEAATIVLQLKQKITVFQTEQARTMMQNSIAFFDSTRASLEASEKKATETRKAADEAAAVAAKAAADADAAKKAEVAKQKAAAAELARQAQIRQIQQLSIDRLGTGGGFFRF
ncbi:hypothetical protein [Rhizobium leguminosarum]|uniref:hypothetical protein n=1 Tax=Rhizobium leguminosarum TaxID=384 RepID=UPI0014422083|nr:hypothetical protein [Rhizobium leguminosarum]MBY5868855.1 hypothetical protein [Rhizobium leguminosarum]NKM06282.1 hypothetical protein [Rhizobium leguminosarum bv. viciae]